MQTAFVDQGKVKCGCGKHPTLAVIQNGGLTTKCSVCDEEVQLAGPEVALAVMIGALGWDRAKFDSIADQLFGPRLKPGESWINPYVVRELEAHKAFGSNWDGTLFMEKLRQYGQERIEFWEDQLGLRVGALPIPIGEFTVEAFESKTYPGWKVRPEDWFYQMSRESKWFLRDEKGELVVCPEPWRLGGEVVLFDPRCKPVYKDGKQMWRHDKNFLGTLLKKLRQEGKIESYKPLTSRFGISSREWDEHIKLATAELLSLGVSQIRLERIIEFNILSQLYTDLPRAKDGQTNTSVWFEEFCGGGSSRAYGGDSDVGGLAVVCADHAGFGWSFRSFRPLGIL